jgi:CDP-diacylglycerol--serine O-phosphatidyltransferase
MNGSPEAQIAYGPPPSRRRLGRSVFLLPSLFTVGNIFCGYYAILATMHANYDHAAQAIGIAIILDMLDGKIARMTNSATDFGLQLDSLADVISFGIAPSILILYWGMASLNSQLAWIPGFTFTICGAMRLARFNVQAGNLKHFVGLPIPAGGGTIAAAVHFFGDSISDPIASWCVLAAVFSLSFLMVSTLRYPSLKHLTLGKKSHLTILVLALLVALIYNYSKPSLLVIAIAYSVSGIAQRILGLIKKKGSSEELALGSPLEHH